MLKKIVFLIAFLLSLAAAAVAQSQSDSLWSRDLGTGTIFDCGFLHDEDFVYAAHHASLYILNASNGEILQSKHQEHVIKSVAISSDGEVMMLAGGEMIRQIDPATLSEIRAYDLPEYNDKNNPFYNNFTDISLKPDKSQFAVAARHWAGSLRTSKIVVYDRETGEMLHSLGDSTVAFWNWVAYSPDGRYLAAATEGYPFYVQVWDAETYEPYMFDQIVWENVNGFIPCIKFTDDSKKLWVAPNTKDIGILSYDLASKSRDKALRPEHGISSFDFFDENILLIGYYNPYYYNIENMTEYFTYEHLSYQPTAQSITLNSEKTFFIGRSALIGALKVNYPPVSVPEETGHDLEYKVFETHVKIILPESTGEISASLSDLQGKTLDTFHIPTGALEYTYNFEHLAAGVYFLTLESGEIIDSIKFVRE